MPVLPICILRQSGFNKKERKKLKMKKMENGIFRKLCKRAMKKEPGIDGILVTVGLCIIALLLCVVMKDSMAAFIKTIVNTLTSEAQKILTGVSVGIVL